MVMTVVIGRFLNCTDGHKLIFYQRFHRFMLRGRARGQYLEHHTFFLSLEGYLMDQYYIWDIGSV